MLGQDPETAVHKQMPTNVNEIIECLEQYILSFYHDSMYSSSSSEAGSNMTARNLELYLNSCRENG